MTYIEYIGSINNTSTTEILHKHHIVPKSEGGSNEESNLIELTPAQHFWAHILYDREHGTITAQRFTNYSHITPKCFEDCLAYNDSERIRINNVKSYKYSEEQCKRRSVSKIGEPHPHKGGFQSPEKGKKISESKNKPVLQYTKEGELIAEYPSTKIAADALGISRGNISNCCLGRYKSAGGFVWKYK